MNKLNYLRMRDAMRDTLAELKPTLMVTHNFLGRYKAETACQRMRQFYCSIQDHQFGRDWAKQFDRSWPVAYGFRQHPNTNPHYHVIVRACPELTVAIAADGPAIWDKLARHGQLDVRRILPGKLDRIIYSTRDLTHDQAWGDMFIYNDTRAHRPG